MTMTVLKETSSHPRAQERMTGLILRSEKNQEKEFQELGHGGIDRQYDQTLCSSFKNKHSEKVAWKAVTVAAEATKATKASSNLITRVLKTNKDKLSAMTCEWASFSLRAFHTKPCQIEGLAWCWQCADTMPRKSWCIDVNWDKMTKKRGPKYPIWSSSLTHFFKL